MTNTTPSIAETKPVKAPRTPDTASTSPKAARAVDTPDPALVAPSIEAVLFSLDKPANGSKIAESLGRRFPGVDVRTVREAVDALNAQYEQSGRAFRIEQVAGGYRVMTLPEHAEAVAAFHAARANTRLSRAAVETLAVVAYRQPVTRVQIESIRGVACGEVLRTLLERRLIAIVGRAEELGRPMLYGTTRQFLELFGLSSVKDLPAVGDLAPDFASLIEDSTDADPSAAVAEEPHAADGDDPKDAKA